MIITLKELPPRREHDHYPTPEWAVRRALDLAVPTIEPKPEILDVGAGAGIWGQIARELWPAAAEITGIDLRELPMPVGYDTWMSGCSFPEAFSHRQPMFTLVIGNPPYGIAEPCVRGALDLLPDGGELIYLLRLAFLEGQKRRDGLFREHPPYQVGVCSKRPSFDGTGKTNATAFAVFHWIKGHQGATKIGWLAGEYPPN
jgi:hypothetical protein